MIFLFILYHFRMASKKLFFHVRMVILYISTVTLTYPIKLKHITMPFGILGIKTLIGMMCK